MEGDRPAPEARGGEHSETGANVCIAADDGSNTTPPPTPQAALLATLDALRFEHIAEMFGYVASYAISAQEAANRCNSALLEVHAKQARLALVSALEVRRELGGAADGAEGAMSWGPEDDARFDRLVEEAVARRRADLALMRREAALRLRVERIIRENGGPPRRQPKARP